MRTRHVFWLSLVAGILWTTAALGQHHNEHDARALAADPTKLTSPIAPTLKGLGEHHHPVTTSSDEAQAFFDQGLKLTYAFNHQEALRAFKEAIRLDPDCAMAYWGVALVLGPNLNLPMNAEVIPLAFEAIQKAKTLSVKVSAREKDSRPPHTGCGVARGGAGRRSGSGLLAGSPEKQEQWIFLIRPDAEPEGAVQNG